MKKIKLLISVFVLFFIGILTTNAASLSVSANKSTVVVGNTVTVTVKASGAAGWEYCLDYDKSVFSLSSTTSDTGGSCVLTGSTLIGYSSVTYKLKAIKSGTSTVTINKAAMYNDNGNEISFSKGSVKLTAKTQSEIEASYSTNNNLKSLSVNGYELSPSFNKNTTSYTLEVPNEVEQITINASKEDSSASITGAGQKELTEGINKFNIVVTAEKGNKKTYTIEVTRQELNPIVVKVGDEEMNVIRKSDALEVPSYYTLSTTIIDDETVPALKSDITGFVLVGLKNENGDINLYIYNEANSTYELYKQVGMEGFTFISLPNPETIDTYPTIKEIDINGLKINSYSNENSSDIVLVYGMNAKTGEKGWYKYDTKEGTFQRYIADSTVSENKNSNQYLTLAIVFACVSGLTIILLIVLMISNSRARKKNNKLIEMLKATKKSPEPKDETLKEDKTPENQKDSEEKAKETKTEEVSSVESKEVVEEPQVEIDKSKLSQRELRRLEKQEAAKKATEEANKAEEKENSEEKDNQKTEEPVLESLEEPKEEKRKTRRSHSHKEEKK